MRRLLLVLALLPAGLYAQTRLPVGLGISSISGTPDTIQITTPSFSGATTTDATVQIAGTFSAQIATIDCLNETTAVPCTVTLDPVTGTFVSAAGGSLVKFSDDFTRTTNATPCSGHTPTSGSGSGIGDGWISQRADGGRAGSVRSLDYMQPDGADATGTKLVLCEWDPSSAISGANYTQKFTLATGRWSISSPANFLIFFGITDTTDGTEDYCFAEWTSNSGSNNLRLVKVVAGTGTQLAITTYASVNSQEWEMRTTGSTTALWQGGVERITATSTDCDNASRGGWGAGDAYTGHGKTLSTQASVDNFIVEDPDAGTSGVALTSGQNRIKVTGCRADTVTCVTATTIVNQGATDTQDPTGTFDSPTDQLTYANPATTLDIAGTALDNVGVDHVTVSVPEATPTSYTATLSGNNWSVTGIGWALGDNHITVTIADAEGNDFALPVRIFTRSAATDSTDPVTTITSPDSDGTSTHSTPNTTLAGNSSDNVGLADTNPVTYSSDTCGSGVLVAVGGGLSAISWSKPIVLTATCTITVTTTDSSGRTGTDTHVATYTPALTIQTPANQTMIEGQAFSYCFIVAGGVPPYTVTKLTGTYPTGTTLTSGCVGDSSVNAGTAGTYTNHSYRVTDSSGGSCPGSACADTGTFTLTVGTDSIGGQNNSNYNEVCNTALPAGTSLVRCNSLRTTAELNDAAVHDTIYVSGFSGLPSWEYNPGGDTDPERQDAAKWRQHGWVHYTPAKTITSALADSTKGTIELVTFSSNSGISIGRPIRIGSSGEILTCISPTHASGNTSCVPAGSTTQAYMMRGTYDTSPDPHSAGDTVYTTTAGNNEHLEFKIGSSTTASETILDSIMFRPTASFAGGAGPIGSQTDCGGLTDEMGVTIVTMNPTTWCAKRWNGFKFFQHRVSGSINWEMKLDTVPSYASTTPAGINTTPGGPDVGAAVFRQYTGLGTDPARGPTYFSGGDVSVRPMANKDFIIKPEWVQVWTMMEINHDQNTAAFVRLSDITAPLTASAEDTTVFVDYTNLPPPPPAGENANVNVIIHNNNIGRGRRLRIDSEIMSITSCTTSGNPRSCTVVRGVDGSTIASHSIGADFELIWDYLTVWIGSETQAVRVILDHAPVLRRRDNGTGNPQPVSDFEWESDDSETRAVYHRWKTGFADRIMYVKNFWAIRKAGTCGAGGCTAAPTEWLGYFDQPTANGN